VLLHHGTTRQRAEAIMRNGPDAKYCEPGGFPAEAFFVAPAEGPFKPRMGHGAPEDSARGKAVIFQAEGGPAILEFELPGGLAETLVGRLGDQPERGKAFNAGVDIAFQPDGGLEELLTVWPTLSKRVILLEGP
jgi:hypothetical protein